MDEKYNQENDYYIRALQHKEIGEPARIYLKKRGIDERTIDYWQIGFCPIGNKQYKKLQGRITFPVYNQSGKIVTISGRKIYDTLNGPKYDMYPFAARKTLFGLWQNRENIREINQAAITEGQLDVITAWQNGFKIATSSFGAHGSLDHLSILSRYAKKINVLYDADEAGFKGVEAIKSLSTLGDLEIKFNNPFPKGEDLDSWIKKHSSEELFNLLNKNEIENLQNKLAKIKRMM